MSSFGYFLRIMWVLLCSIIVVAMTGMGINLLENLPTYTPNAVVVLVGAGALTIHTVWRLKEVVEDP